MHAPPFTIRNSPIEFVLLGPLDGKDQILVRSENAGLDLIGRVLVSEDNTGVINKKGDHESPFFMYVLLNRSTQINVVKSEPFRDIFSKSDNRHSRYIFAWRGRSRKYDLLKIKNMLKECLRSIAAHSESGINESIIELHFAPLILGCAEIERHFGKQKELLGYFVIAYFGIVIFVTALAFPKIHQLIALIFPF